MDSEDTSARELDGRLGQKDAMHVRTKDSTLCQMILVLFVRHLIMRVVYYPPRIAFVYGVARCYCHVCSCCCR